MEELPRIKLASVRTAKEKIYYLLVVLVSIGVWAWTFYSIYKDFGGNLGEKSQELGQSVPVGGLGANEPCFIRVGEVGKEYLTRIEPSALLMGESCVSREELNNQECFYYKGFSDDVEKIDIYSIKTGTSCMTPNNFSREQLDKARAEDQGNTADSGLLPSMSDVTSMISQVSDALTTPVLIIVFFVIGLYSHLLAMAYVRMNGVKVGPHQFPEVYGAVKQLSARLGMHKQPDTFVITGHGVLNAFATRLVFRRIVVVYSDLVEALVESGDHKQLLAVLSHELGHQALGHTRLIEWFLWPGQTVPFLGSALSRAREYSCDRIMKVLITDSNVCERALVKLAAGGSLGAKTDIEVYLNQSKEEGGFFAWLSERLSTHPHLPNRIIEVRKYGVLKHPGEDSAHEKHLG